MPVGGVSEHERDDEDSHRNSLGSILATNSILLIIDLQVSFTRVALLTGYHLVAVAVAALFVSPFARIYGFRLPYLVGIVIIFASSIWAACASSYGSLLGARVLQGMAVAPFEALVPVSIGNLYPVAQRGSRMAAAALALYGCTFLTPLVAGAITDAAGWHWTFGVLAIFTAASSIAFVFYMPEHLVPESGDTASGHYCNLDETLPGMSYRDMMALFNGRLASHSFWQLFLRPFTLLPLPFIIWAMFSQGTLICWTVMLSTGVAGIYKSGLGSPTEIGKIYAGPLVGAILGFAFAGLVTDRLSVLLGRLLNHGRGPLPQYRLPLIAVQVVVGVPGLLGFGRAMERNPNSSELPAFCFGLVAFAMVCSVTGTSTYITDAYHNVAIESFICLMLFKNLVSCGLTSIIYPWITSAGAFKVMYITAIVQSGVCLSTIVMWLISKPMQKWFYGSYHPCLAKWGVW